MNNTCSILWITLICFCITANAQKHHGFTEGGQDSLDQMSSLGDAISKADKQKEQKEPVEPVHVVYVHGIGAEGPGDSVELQKSICSWLGDCTNKKFQPISREWADTGLLSPDHPPGYLYMGNEVWKQLDEWRASAPFVDHYVISRKAGTSTVIDEINWWPIVFPVKCRNIMAAESPLSGLYKQYFADCTRTTTLDKDNLHYSQFAWISSGDTAAKPEQKAPRSAFANAYLKNNVVDWRFSDAILAVGSLHDLFVEAMRQLLVKSASFNPDGSRSMNWAEDKSQQFVFVTHSLGSYLTLSTLNLDRVAGGPFDSLQGVKAAAVNYIFKRTPLIYFFANQIPLLELGNIQFPADSSGDGTNLTQPIKAWSQLRCGVPAKGASLASCPVLPQIVAWSDSSDLLTFKVPPMEDAKVVNLYVVNSVRFLWLFECPTPAHDDYVINKYVIKTMMKPIRHPKRAISLATN